MAANPSFTILIIGGGVAGLAASIGLRRKGHKVTVLESTPTLQTLGGSLLIPPNAARVLNAYGLWEKFKEAETIPRGHTTYRYEDGSVLEEVDYSAMEGTFGFSVMSIPRANYQKLLYDSAIELGVEVRLSSRIQSLDEKTPSVTLTTGEIIKGDFIIGADGIKSIVRSAILGGHDVQPIPDSLAYQCTVSGNDMRSNPLTASLMEEGAIHTWYAPSRQIISASDSSDSYRVTATFYPSSDSSDSTSSLSSTDIVAANSSSSYRLGSTTAFRNLVSDFEPRVRKVVELVKPEDCFLWKLAYLPSLKSWVSESGKVVLLGDAAHAMVPHLGAGAATAVEDGGVLAECLSHPSINSTSAIPQALKAYESLRRPRAERMQTAAVITGHYKAMADGPAQKKRDEKMAQRMDKKNPKYEYWKAGGGLEWLYGYDFLKEATKAMNNPEFTMKRKEGTSHKL